MVVTNIRYYHTNSPPHHCKACVIIIVLLYIDGGIIGVDLWWMGVCEHDVHALVVCLFDWFVF